MQEELKQLKAVSETLFVPLCARYFETVRPDGIIRDDLVAKVLERLCYDCSRFSNLPSIQLGVAVRTKILDRETSRFLSRNPQAAVVNLGAGLCTRFARIDNQEVLWLELDLPEVHQLWKKAFVETDRHHFVTGSVMHFRWIPMIKKLIGQRPVLFIAEGLLMYFPEAEVKRLLLKISEEFAGSEMLLEAMSPLIASHTKYHPAVSKTRATFKWGTRSLRALEKWSPRIQCLDEWYHLDFHRDRWGWMRVLRLIPSLHQQMKIGHLRFS